MRVVKAAQFGIQSALIGGAFVLLGGVALADTSTPGNSSPVTPQSQSGTNLKVTNGNSASVTNSGQGTVSVTNNTNTTNSSGSNSQGGTVLSSTDQNGNSNPPSGTATAGNDQQGPTVSNPTSNNQDTQSGSPVTSTTIPPANQNHTAVAPATAPVAPQSQPVLPAAQAAPVVIFRSRPLKIQPVIETSSVTDMAAGLASLPTPASAPVPPKPNSALGHLTAVLADTIVPVLFFLISVPVRQGLAIGVFATFIVLLLGAFISNYGLWLRRGGFATAARSDAPSLRTISPFATPQFLGYVFAPPRIEHNPVFVVAEIKTGGYSLRGL
jgi:hypothetical protein